MSISENTAAIVAAQLTVAWATRLGARTANIVPAKNLETRLLQVYEHFHAEVSKTPPSREHPPIPTDVLRMS